MDGSPVLDVPRRCVACCIGCSALPPDQYCMRPSALYLPPIVTHSTCCVDLEVGPGPLCLSSEAAFRIFPIAHHYDMHLLQKWCNKAIERAQLDLWPSAPIASSEVPKHPGFVQWLALADSKQCAPLVETCLSQLLCKESNATIREAVASPHLRHIIDGLRLETKMSMLYKLAGLPLGFQVPMNTLFHTCEVLHMHTCCLPRFGRSACTCMLQRH